MHAGRRDGRSFGNWCLEKHNLINMRKSLTINCNIDACRKTIIKGLVKLLPKGQWIRSAAHHKFSQEFKTHFADFDSSQSFMCADKFCFSQYVPWTTKKTAAWLIISRRHHQRSQAQQKSCSRFFYYQMTDQDDFYLLDDWPRCSRTGRAQWRWRQAPG